MGVAFLFGRIDFHYDTRKNGMRLILALPNPGNNIKMAFSLEEQNEARQLIRLARAEDLAERGDLTSQALIGAEAQGRAVFVARSPGILAGLPLLELMHLEWPLPLPEWRPILCDGHALAAGDRIGTWVGNLRGILGMERTVLNFLQHLSGIATLTRRYVDAVQGLPVKILDTRKTLPGWRRLAKYAVRQGGGTNHRLGLYDGFLIKDNHLAALHIRDSREQIVEAVKRARHKQSELAGQGIADLRVEIEVDRLDQFDVAIEQQPDIILLDNMSVDQLREAVRRRDAVAGKVALEASGGITLATIRAIAATGVDRISVGALTHSAPALDLALDYELEK